ncbi:uncharacterized protein LOC128870229 [Anastrepha ludens]|uniref:uncharacterized protein LOC128870229 n=1 Tax=Anastrepha ludens TaxID=28586 RepID=UPI0023AEE78D|nr:uncharacterized protein LOC128870229 [Anastrepha ludens]
MSVNNIITNTPNEYILSQQNQALFQENYQRSQNEQQLYNQWQYATNGWQIANNEIIRLNAFTSDLQKQIDELKANLLKGRPGTPFLIATRSATPASSRPSTPTHVNGENIEYHTDEDELAKETEWIRVKHKTKKRKMNTTPSPATPKNKNKNKNSQTNTKENKKEPMPPPIILEDITSYEVLYNQLISTINADAFQTKIINDTTPSALSLRTMIDTVSAVYDSLLSLGDEKNITNAIIIHLVMSKVDTVTRSKWEEQLDYDKLPLWHECEAALSKRYQHLSADEASTSRLKPSNSHSIQKPHLHAGRAKAALVTSNIKQPVCPHCKSNDHSIPACPTFKTLSAQQRFEFAKSVPLCINCLRKGHSVSKCKADRCRVCNRSHHTLLHQYPVSFATAPQLSTSHAMHTTSTPDRVMLATAVVNVKRSSGEYLAARALLDSGSQVNFMTEDLAQKLRICRESTTLNIIGIGNATKKVRTKLNTFVKSRVNNYEFSAQFWIMRSISVSHPDRNVNINGWKIPKNISLADPEFYKAQKVDLLLGAETFFELLAVGQIKASPNHPTLQKTLLGWVVSGKYASNQRPPPTVSSTLCHTEQDLANIDSIVQRFIGRRGMPRKIYSDNATNFVGADRKLRELRDAFEAQQTEVQKYATDEGFTFAFIPPRAPHFGGLWEAAVKSAKHLLVRAIGNALLTAEELQTLLVEVEAVLNSRPLVPLSQDPNDGEALTPAHLLVGCPLRALSPAQVSMGPRRCCDRWQLVCCLKQQFWRLWSRNYLLGLQQRSKWLHPKRNLELNDLVLVQEDNAPPQQWVLGRVAAIVTGQDGKVRVADVATKAGVIKPPVHKLAVLPSDIEGP